MAAADVWSLVLMLLVGGGWCGRRMLARVGGPACGQTDGIYGLSLELDGPGSWAEIFESASWVIRIAHRA